MSTRELIHYAGEPYPSERERTDHGTRTIPHLALGRYGTGRVGVDAWYGSDQLHSDVVAAAEYHGYAAPAAVGRLRVALGDRPGAKLGPVESLALAEEALAAVAWLNREVAPEGREFVLEDALYLIATPERRAS